MMARGLGHQTMIARGLRGLAFIIAIAAAIDPAITLRARSRPDVAVVAGATDADSELAERVTRELSGTFNVVHGGFAQAAATVFVGDRLQMDGERANRPVFVVTPARALPSLAINAVRAPTRAPMNGRVAVTADVRVHGGRGGTLELTLTSGRIVVDRVRREITRDEALQTVQLEFNPTASGVTPYTVTATLDGGAEPASVDGFVDVNDQRWSVLFYDPRPSWQSTFVRRALERDPRFLVSSRVIASRALTRDAGRPADLDDAAALSAFDVVVVGAPDALSANAVAALNRLLRRHAGSVVLLFDRRGATPTDRLAGVTWTSGTAASALALQTSAQESGALRVTEAMWPTRLPAGAVTLARTPAAKDSTTHPIIWRTAVGAGQLTSSGALNAWQFRSAEFDRFWQSLIGQAAAAREAPINMLIAQPLLRAAESTDIRVALRDVAHAQSEPGATVHATVSAALQSADSNVPLTLWPAGIGTFRGVLHAPARSGAYRLVVKSGTATTETPVLIAEAASRATPDSRDLQRAAVISNGGRILPESRLDELSDLIERVARPERRREARHPMRSFWWMFPFALALSTEWWLRRRVGLR